MDCLHVAAVAVGGGNNNGSIIRMYASTIVLEASDDNQSLGRTLWTIDRVGTPALAALSRTQRECTSII
jgi:hypothetical protein